MSRPKIETLFEISSIVVGGTRTFFNFGLAAGSLFVFLIFRIFGQIFYSAFFIFYSSVDSLFIFSILKKSEHKI